MHEDTKVEDGTDLLLSWLHVINPETTTDVVSLNYINILFLPLGHFHVFVGDLSPEITTDDIKAAFAPFGKIS